MKKNCTYVLNFSNLQQKQLSEKFSGIIKSHLPLLSMFMLMLCSFIANASPLPSGVTLAFGDNGTLSNLHSYTFASSDVFYGVTPIAISANTSNICTVNTVSVAKRSQHSVVMIKLNSTDINVLNIVGISNSSSATRTLSSIDITSDTTTSWNNVSSATYTINSVIPISTSGCGTINVTGLNIAKGKYVKLTFNGSVNISGFYINVAPSFTTSSPSLNVCKNSSSNNVASLLHVSDTDPNQTETWSQSSAPSHGSLTISSATAASGSSNITPGGTITYTPTAGYSGSDQFTIQVSDGTSTTTQIVNVTVNDLPATPGTPTSNSPQCANSGVTLTKNGTVPGGETWYWQGINSAGTSTSNSAASTYNAGSSNTYYINSLNTASGCWSASSSLTVTVNALPTVTFVSHPATATATVNTTYSTQSGMSNYSWTVNGTNGTDYSIQSGGSSTDNSITLQWLTAGSHSLTVNYANGNNCYAVSATSTNTTVSALSTSPELTANGSATVDNSFDLTFTDDATWRAAITSVQYGATTLTASTDYTISAGKITLIPGQAIKTAGTQDLTINATGYVSSIVSQTIAAGAATQIVVHTQPTAPSTNGAALATQPVIYIKDQYNNFTDASVTASVGNGSWTLGGTTVLSTSNGITSFSGLTASSYAAVTGASINFTTGLLSTSSASFNIAIPAPPALTAAVAATVDNNFNITFTDNPIWRSAISSIAVVKNGVNNTLSGSAYDISVAGQITFKPAQSTLLQTSRTDTFIVSSTGYADNTVIQVIVAGLPNKLVMKTQPTAPALNGGPFLPQPAINVRDQYGNATTSNASVTATVGSGSWTILGTVTKTASNGAITWTDLVATSAAVVTGATITFTSPGLTSVTCNSFNLPVPAAATTYYWVGGSAAVQNWNASVWSTSKGGTAIAGFSPLTTDIYIFDGTNVGSGATGNINVTSSTTNLNVGQIKLQNGANVTFTQSTTRTFNINGGSGADLLIDATSTLTSTGSGTTINLLTGTTGSIDGQLILGTGNNNHIIAAADAGALVFNNHSKFTYNPGTYFYPFGQGTDASVVFNNGSTFTNVKSGDPFGGSLHSIVSFQTGSTYEYQTSGGAASMDGRTLKNISYTGATGGVTITSSNGFTCDNFGITNAQTVTMNGTGTVHIKGNITIPSGAGLSFSPASSSSLIFDGPSAQNINNTGTLTFGANQSVTIASTVNLGSSIAVDGPLSISSGGKLSIGSNTLTINGTISGTGSLVGSQSSNLVMNGASASSLKFNQNSTDNFLQNLTLTGAGQVTLNSDVNVIGVLGLKNSSANLNLNGSRLTLKATWGSGYSSAVVDQVTAGATVTGGTVTVERYIPQGNRLFRDLGTGGVATTGTFFSNWQENGTQTPYYGIYITGKKGNAFGVDASTGLDITRSGAPSLYTYGAGSWPSILNTKVTIDPYQGYRVLVRGDRNLTNFGFVTDPVNMTSSTIIRTTGNLIIGDVTFNSTTGVTNGVASSSSTKLGAGASDWTLITNPYACPIDWHTIGKTNVSPTYWYFDPTFSSNGYATYVTYNATPGVQINSNPTKSNVNRYIQPGQGFFVQNAGTSPVLTISETNKVPASTQTAIFGATKPNYVAVTLWKNINGNNENIDGAVTVFNNSFTRAIKEEDSKKIINSGENLFITEGTTDLSIEGMQEPVANDVIALNFNQLVANTTYQLKVDLSNFTTAAVTAYIHDALTNTDVPATNEISFTPTSNTATYAGRFSVVFKAAKINPVILKGAVSIYPNPVTNNKFNLQMNNLEKGTYTVSVMNNLGQEVMNTIISSDANNGIKTITTKGLTTGVYTVHVVGNNTTYNTEMIVK